MLNAFSETRTSAASGRLAPLRALAGQGGRVASTALRPVQGAAGTVAGVGLELQRRAVDRVLDSAELERVITAAVESIRVQRALETIMSSQAAEHLVDSFFDGPLFDRVVDRLLESDGLWRLIDDVAASPVVRAAVSQQGLGFADQVGGEVRRRSRRADDWLERAAQGLVRRRPAEAPQTPTAAPQTPDPA